MRLAYASDDLGPHDRRILRTLAAGPHEVHLLTFCNRLEALPAWLASECPRVRVHHRRFGAYPELPGGGWLERWRDERRYLAAFAEGLEAIRPDLLHAGWVQTTGYAAFRSGFRPYFLMPWGSDILVWPERSRRDRRKARLSLQAAAGIACDATHVRDRIVAISGIDPARISVFPWGVELDRFHPPSGIADLRMRMGWGKHPVVVMTRQMRDPYGVLEFARLWGRVLERVPDARLLLVGDGVQRPEIERTLAPWPGTWSVSGEVDMDVVPSYLECGDVYVSNASTDGTSVSLLEAMATGLPAVVTDLPALREWVSEGGTGYLVPSGDADAMVDRIVRLLGDPALRKALGAKALAAARARADWRRHAQALLDGYARALKGSAPPS